MTRPIPKAPIVVLAACGLLLAAWPATAATPTVTGTVGPGKTITVSAKPTKAGIYRLTVRDLSSEHNFHIRGPGVNRTTGIESTGTRTFTIKLKPGKTYSFVCDPHSDEMRGSFKTRT